MTPASVRPAAEAVNSQSPRSGAARSESSDSERAAFERLLRNRDTQRGVGHQTKQDQEPIADSFADVWTAPGEPRTIHSGTQPMQAAPGRAGVIGSESASALRQSEQARMADQPTQQLARSAADGPGTWQATLPNPGGADWQLRASREAGATPGITGWSVAISSPALESGMLQRNAGRLTERLQERLPGRSVRLTVNSGTAVRGGEIPAFEAGDLTPDQDDPR